MNKIEGTKDLALFLMYGERRTAMPPVEKLKSCPFCGSGDDIHILYNKGKDGQFTDEGAVWCYDREAHGPDGRGAKNIVRAWNRRDFTEEG